MKRFRLMAGVLVLATAAIPVVTQAHAESASAIRITKIHYAQIGTDLDTEYIVLKNTTSSNQTITGWRIVSAPVSDAQYYVFPTTTVPAGASLTLYTGAGTNTTRRRYWNAGSPRWDNDGDLAILKNSSGTKIDSCRYAGGGTVAYC